MTTALPVLSGAERNKALLDAVLVVARDGLGLPPEMASDRTLEVLCNTYRVSPAQAQLSQSMAENLLNNETAAHVSSIDRLYNEWSAAERAGPATGRSDVLIEKARAFAPVPDTGNSANTVAALSAIVRVRKSRIWERLGLAVGKLGASEMQFDDAAADTLTAIIETLAPALKQSAAIAEGALAGQGGVAYAAIVHNYVDSIERSLATLESAALKPRQRDSLPTTSFGTAKAGTDAATDESVTAKRSECQLSRLLGIVHSSVGATRGQSPARTSVRNRKPPPAVTAPDDDSSDDEAPAQPPPRRRSAKPPVAVKEPEDDDEGTARPPPRRRAVNAVVPKQPSVSPSVTAADIAAASKLSADGITKASSVAWWWWIGKFVELLWVGATVFLTAMQAVPAYLGASPETYYEYSLRAYNKATGIAPYESRNDASLPEKLYFGMFVKEADLADDVRNAASAAATGLLGAVVSPAYPALDYFASAMGYGLVEQQAKAAVVTGMRYIPGSLVTATSAIKSRVFDLIFDLSGLTNSLRTADPTKLDTREVGIYDQLLSITILLLVVMSYVEVAYLVSTALRKPFAASRKLAADGTIKLIELVAAKLSRRPAELTGYQLYLLRQQGLLTGPTIPRPQDLTPQQQAFLENKKQASDPASAARSQD
jgi:hypothetical protein